MYRFGFAMSFQIFMSDTTVATFLLNEMGSSLQSRSKDKFCRKCFVDMTNDFVVLQLNVPCYIDLCPRTMHYRQK